MKGKKNRLKTIKWQKKHILLMGKVVKSVNWVSRASTSNMWTGLWTPLGL
jgi:hypothetical protein